MEGTLFLCYQTLFWVLSPTRCILSVLRVADLNG